MSRTRATAVVIKDESILMMHRHNNGEEYFVLPGGGIEEGESGEEAVIRELKEETSIDAALGEKLLEFTDARGENHILFSCDYTSGEPMLEAGSIEAKKSNENQSYEPKWIDIKDISSLMIYPKEEKEFLVKYLK
jgi:8-oxo-dGTP pyrophosphatase MutT (NUDIX family)